ncbi:MAG: peroxidase family protein, partial [Xanthobacteraceae bacterium]
LLLDTNPFVNLLDHYVAGDGRANENFALTAMHTVWARNHNFHVENLLASGFAGSPEDIFQTARMLNEAEYQRVVFSEFADKLIGGIRGDGTHGHVDYDPDATASISYEFAAAVYRVGHSLIGQTMTVLDQDGNPRQVALFDAFLNPTNAAAAFTAPLPTGYVPQPGYKQLGVSAILGGIATQPAEAVDFNIVDAVRNDLVRINADLFAFNVARGWDVGLGTLNQVRMDLAASQDPYVREAVGFAGVLTTYTSWEDFQTRNDLSDTVIAQFKQAYPDLELAAADIAAFQAINPDIAVAMRSDGTGVVKGIDRVDLWVGGLAETHVNGGMVGQTFWVVLHEQMDRLQDADRFYYLDRFDNFDFYKEFVDGQEFSDIVARNTGLAGLPESIFEVSDEDGVGAGGDDGNAGPGDDDDDDVDDNDNDDTDDDCNDDHGDTAGTDDTTGNGTGTGAGTGTAPPSPAPALVGTAAADVLTGTGAADDIVTFTGDDVVVAGGGADTVSLGDGNDFAKAGAGDDTVFAGTGDDLLFGEDGADTLFGDAGNDRIFAGVGDDRIEAGGGDDTVMGGSGDDLLVASIGDGDDTWMGEAGNDTLDMSALTAAVQVDLGSGLRGTATSAQSGHDTLQEIENVVTGIGGDTITANNVANVMDGGAGDDTFRFVTIESADGDRILGFEPGDRIDISAIDANLGNAGDQAFALIDGAALTGPGQLTVTHQTDGGQNVTVVQGTCDAGTTADFKIVIEGTHTLTAQNFAL